MPSYHKGHARPPNLDHLRHLSLRRNKGELDNLPAATEPAWDSVALGWVPPVKDQGQCHDAATEVLTEKGWVPWSDYDWKQGLGTMNPVTGALEFQPPLQRHVYDHDGPMYHSDNERLDFALTPDHRLFACPADKVSGRRGEAKVPPGGFGFTAIKDIGWRVALPGCTSGWLGTELERLGVGGRTYDGDDFLALVAIVISCGHVGHVRDGDGGQNRITFCCFRDGRQEEMRALAHRLGIKEDSTRPGVWYFNDAALAEWFRQNAYREGGYTAVYKHVPHLVKCASRRQIAHFLNVFGDQHVRENGERAFFSSSALMADDLQELLLRVGRRGAIGKTPPRASVMADGRVVQSRHDAFTVGESRGGLLSLDRKKHLRTDHYKGKVYCATVPNGTLVTRRNKSVLVSANCGSCWNFSGTGVVEIAYWKAGFKNVILSEQYTMSCGRNGGCNGDDNTTVLEWAKKTGLPLDSDYGPYTARAGRCAFKQGMTLYKVDDWGFADKNGGQGVTAVQDIKDAIKNYGGVGCAIAADDAFMNVRPGTVFDRNTSSGIDHDVILVGWDDSKGSKGAWKLRNSWGANSCVEGEDAHRAAHLDVTWCEGGYCWIGYGVNKVGTEAVWGKVNAAAPPVDFSNL